MAAGKEPDALQQVGLSLGIAAADDVDPGGGAEGAGVQIPVFFKFQFDDSHSEVTR